MEERTGRGRFVRTDAFKAKLREANARQFSVPGARARHSERTHQLWQDPDYRARQVAAKKGRTLPLSQRQRIGASHRGMKRPLETGRRISEAQKKRWAGLSREERLRICTPGLKLARTTSPTSIEMIVRDLLESLGVRYCSQYPIGPFVVDFYIPRRRLVVECDGEYWHNLPGKREEDMRRDDWLQERGYRVLRLSESQIHRGEFGELSYN